MFRGPHGYVSPGWLTTPAGRNGVPTWNFAVVHATGRLKAIDEPAQKHALLSSLIRKYETAIGGTAYDFAALPMDDVLARAKGIQPFSIEIEALEGKFKLFQERPEPDKAAALPKLDVYRERSLRAFTEHFLRFGDPPGNRQTEPPPSEAPMRTNRSKTRAWSAGGMPGPSLETRSYDAIGGAAAGRRRRRGVGMTNRVVEQLPTIWRSSPSSP